ncbi:hypothetical protein [Streptomyces sp. NPDC059816]|uniref:hypothetical protein n=1 Tax=Streptomyces sp. NPDC059816 TaxID=3346960 RepID=UPI0036605935
MPLSASCPPTVRELPPLPRLDPAALRLLRQVAAGVPAPEIAQGLGVSPVTVAGRITALRRDLEARNRIHAACLGVLHGLVTGDHVPLPVRRPRVRDGDRCFLDAALGGASAARIALQLGRTKNTVDSALARLRDDFTARDRAQLAAAALLTDSVDCAAADRRFPALPLSAFTAGHPAADCGRQP